MKMNIELKAIDELIYEVEMFEQAGVYPVQDFIDTLKTLAAKVKEETKLEGCVVVPKDKVETWWQDAEEPENFATTIETIPALGENLGDKEIMEIDEHHTIHLPSKRVYGTWVEKDGDRSFITGSLEECRATVEAARGGNHD